jgi:predicted  nucleic acid-binding Zn-ribbon protein
MTDEQFKKFHALSPEIELGETELAEYILELRYRFAQVKAELNGANQRASAYLMERDAARAELRARESK